VRRLLLPAVLIAFAAWPAVSDADVYLTKDEALRDAFGDARIERKSFILEEAQVNAVQQRAKARLESKIVAAYVAMVGDSLIGTAFFDTRIVRTMPGVFMMVIAPDVTVREVQLLAFHEPSDYEPSRRWLGQYDGRPLEAGLWPKRDIRNISGATLTARTITESVRLALAMYEVLVVPELEAE